MTREWREAIQRMFDEHGSAVAPRTVIKPAFTMGIDDALAGSDTSVDRRVSIKFPMVDEAGRDQTADICGICAQDLHVDEHTDFCALSTLNWDGPGPDIRTAVIGKMGIGGHLPKDDVHKFVAHFDRAVVVGVHGAPPVSTADLFIYGEALAPIEKEAIRRAVEAGTPAISWRVFTKTFWAEATGLYDVRAPVCKKDLVDSMFPPTCKRPKGHPGKCGEVTPKDSARLVSIGELWAREDEHARAVKTPIVVDDPSKTPRDVKGDTCDVCAVDIGAAGGSVHDGDCVLHSRERLAGTRVVIFGRMGIAGYLPSRKAKHLRDARRWVETNFDVIPVGERGEPPLLTAEMAIYGAALSSNEEVVLKDLRVRGFPVVSWRVFTKTFPFEATLLYDVEEVDRSDRVSVIDLWEMEDLKRAKESFVDFATMTLSAEETPWCRCVATFVTAGGDVSRCERTAGHSEDHLFEGVKRFVRCEKAVGVGGDVLRCAYPKGHEGVCAADLGEGL